MIEFDYVFATDVPGEPNRRISMIVADTPHAEKTDVSPCLCASATADETRAPGVRGIQVCGAAAHIRIACEVTWCAFLFLAPLQLGARAKCFLVSLTPFFRPPRVQRMRD